MVPSDNRENVRPGYRAVVPKLPPNPDGDPKDWPEEKFHRVIAVMHANAAAVPVSIAQDMLSVFGVRVSPEQLKEAHSTQVARFVYSLVTNKIPKL